MMEGEFGAERSLDDPVEATAAIDEPTPGEYEATEQSGGESPETGVRYERTGEPEKTPHDLALEQAEDEDTL